MGTKGVLFCIGEHPTAEMQKEDCFRGKYFFFCATVIFLLSKCVSFIPNPSRWTRADGC